MKHLRNRAVHLLFGFTLAAAFLAKAATLPGDWQHEQQFDVSAPGLVKINLPVETLDAARPALEDLRLFDDAGNEVPYLIERPARASRIIQNAKSFQTSLNPASTVVTLETGLAQSLDGVTLETPYGNFIKSVQVEGSTDGKRWQNVSEGKVIFRQPNGARQLHLGIPPAVWPWLRLTVDDQRSQPIPFTGARVHAAASEPPLQETVPATISERHENPGETRLTLNLGAANLELSEIQIETTEPLFTRQVTLAVPQISEDSVREQTVANGVVYRVAIEGQPASANLSVPLQTQVRSRELLMLIQNNDSPPLPVTAVRAQRRPVYLVFLARQSGAHYLLTGNAHCAAPRYDLAALGTNLKTALTSTKVSPLTGNPAYHAPEVLPDVQDTGAALDVSAWKTRKSIKVARAGAQQLELDLDVLSHAQGDFGDLRLMRDGKQVSYIIDRTSIQRTLTPVVTATNDVRNPNLSRWIVRFPQAHLPITRLVCNVRTPLFQREISVYEQMVSLRNDGPDQIERKLIGQTSWVNRPSSAQKEFSVTLNGSVLADTIFLETHNGDNSPIQLENVHAFYPATRILFKAKPGDELFLYYGNPNANAPSYDLSLVANELLAADKAPASSGAEEQLKKSSWRDQTPGKGGVVFWGILALVVVVLLVIISRLLPKSEQLK